MKAIDFCLSVEQQYINSKQKLLKEKKYPLCLWNISGDFSANDMEKKTGLNGCVHDFFVDYNTFDISVITDIHKYLMKKHDINNVWVN